MMPENNDLSSLKNLYVLGAILLAGLLLYAPGFTIPPYGDDFLEFFPPLSYKVFTPFVDGNPMNGFYRPIPDSFLVLVQSLVGSDGWPIHVTHWLLQSLLCFLIYLGATRIGLTRLQGLLAAGFMLVSQANVHPVMSYDTASQVLACVFGYLSIYLLLVAWERRTAVDPPGARRAFIISILAYTLALFSKETGVGFAFVIGMLILVASLKETEASTPVRVRRAVIRGLPYLIVLIVFVVIRSQIASLGPVIGGDERYGFNLGVNVVRNLGMLGFAALTPASSADVFVSFTRGGLSTQSITLIALTLLAVLVVAYGYWKADRRINPFLLALLAVLSMTPVYLLNKVSELYVYNAMPIVSLMAGIGLSGLILTARGSKLGLAAGIAFIVVLFADNVWSSQRKIEMMRECAVKGGVVLEDVVRYAREVPEEGKLVLFDHRMEDEVYYSVFLMHGLQLMTWSNPLIKYLSHREDISIVYHEVGTGPTPLIGPDDVVLEMCEDRVHVCKRRMLDAER